MRILAKQSGRWLAGRDGIWASRAKQRKEYRADGTDSGEGVRWSSSYLLKKLGRGRLLGILKGGMGLDMPRTENSTAPEFAVG